MQNNVTELTQKLLRSLDNNYNVIDMPAVLEIISFLEKVAITKELLETTRLGKHVNELRRKTTNDSLSKRAKELVKKWRSMVLPEPNGQIRTTPPPPPAPPQIDQHEDVNLNQLKKRRAAKDLAATALGSPDSAAIAPPTAKRAKLNGIAELDFSDNSNSSFKDVINNSTTTTNLVLKNEPKRDVILINSDSNSSLLEGRMPGVGAAAGAAQDPPLEQPQPKKRGRKKGSKNHKNLIDEAESAFSSKLAVSRGNSKVKTTQELIASLQNRNSLSLSPVNSSGGKSKEDLNERAAKLTERVSIIDQKLNTNANRFKNSKNKRLFENKFDLRAGVVESGSVVNDKGHFNSLYDDEEVIIVDEAEEEPPIEEDDEEEEEEDKKAEKQETEATGNELSSLSVEEALAQLPPVDKSVLFAKDDDNPPCTCILREIPQENLSPASGDETAENAVSLPPKFEMVEDPECPAKKYLVQKYNLDCVTDEQVEKLHNCCIPSVNGNLSLGGPKPGPQMLDNGLYVNVVPNVNIESIPRGVKSDFPSENFKKYSISEGGVGDGGAIANNVDSNNGSGDKSNASSGDKTNNCSFREWHEVVETSSYNGEVLRILPYVIID